MSSWPQLSFSILVFIANLVFLWYVIRKIRKIILKLSTNRRDTLYKCSLLSPSLSVSLLKYWIMTCFHLFSEYQTTNFSHKYYVTFVLIFSNAQNLETKILFGTIRFLFQLRNIGGKIHRFVYEKFVKTCSELDKNIELSYPLLPSSGSSSNWHCLGNVRPSPRLENTGTNHNKGWSPRTSRKLLHLPRWNPLRSEPPCLNSGGLKIRKKIILFMNRIKLRKIIHQFHWWVEEMGVSKKKYIHSLWKF